MFGVIGLLVLVGIPPAHKLARMGLGGKEPRVWKALGAPQDRGFDVLSYDVDLRLDPETRTLRGVNRIRIRRIWADSAYLMLHPDLTVDTFRINGRDTLFLRQGDTLVFALTGGGEDTVEVVYGGTPPTPTGFGGGMYFVGSPVHTVFTDNEPYGLRRWLAALDAPDDKVLLRMTVRVPPGWLVGSNGALSLADLSDSGWTWVWLSRYPIASYLIHVAASREFVLLAEQVPVQVGGQTVTIPLWNYVPRAETADAAVEFAHLPDMLQYFSDLFGLYPFAEEKYGHTCVLPGWAMENQTMTAYLADLSPSPGVRDWILAHELGHHWWGNWVTLEDFDHIWLNEGFATYTEALYIGHRDSTVNPNAYHAYIASEMNDYLGSCGGSWGDPILPPAQLFSWCNTYTKAGLVLHMLRGVMGDSLFFEGLRLYGRTFEYANARTEDFRAVMESVWGQSLGWFFQQWIYSPGFPHYRWGWVQQGNVLEVVIHQIQDSTVSPAAVYFRMPLRIRVVYEDGRDTVGVIWSEALPVQRLTFPVSGVVSTVVLDEGNWVLDLQTLDPTVAVEEYREVRNAVRVVRASRGGILLHVSRRPRSLQVFDLLGRRYPVRVIREGMRVRLEGSLKPGGYRIRVDGRTYPVVVP